MGTKLLGTLLLLGLATASTAQEFGKYKLPNGSIYVGDNPPPDAERMGTVGGAVTHSISEPPTRREEIDKRNEAHSNAMLVKQKQLEHVLERAQDDLERVRAQISDAQNFNTNPIGRYQNWRDYWYDQGTNINAENARLTQLRDKESDITRQIYRLENEIAQVRADR
jgi:peptidoglycan hydrolase CwlO-like protein